MGGFLIISALRAEESDVVSLLAPCGSCMNMLLGGLVVVSSPQAAGAVDVVSAACTVVSLFMAVLVLVAGVVSSRGSLVFKVFAGVFVVSFSHWDIFGVVSVPDLVVDVVLALLLGLAPVHSMLLSDHFLLLLLCFFRMSDGFRLLSCFWSSPLYQTGFSSSSSSTKFSLPLFLGAAAPPP